MAYGDGVPSPGDVVEVNLIHDYWHKAAVKEIYYFDSGCYSILYDGCGSVSICRPWRWPVDKQKEDRQQLIDIIVAQSKELEDLKAWKRQAEEANREWNEVRDIAEKFSLGKVGTSISRAVADSLHKYIDLLGVTKGYEQSSKEWGEVRDVARQFNSLGCYASIPIAVAAYLKDYKHNETIIKALQDRLKVAEAKLEQGNVGLPKTGSLVWTRIDGRWGTESVIYHVCRGNPSRQSFVAGNRVYDLEQEGQTWKRYHETK